VRPARALLDWFDRHRRDLPWRRTRDPYLVWISEIMLQQTRVETVIPYYERFIARFPAVEDLARADLEEVLALWSGLGYYRRGRQLHAAARQVAETGRGFPSTLEELRELPGIGDYTAAAVGSIAFGIAAPVMDGNVERVLSRWIALEEDPKGRGARQALFATAAGLLDPERPGDSNQALMELGATICVPRRPRCLLCPIREGCRAAAQGDPERFPVARPKRARERRLLTVAFAESEGRVLLFRRPEGSALLAGTWELPWVEEKEEPEAALAARYGGSWEVGPVLGEVRHSITFRDLELEVRRARVRFAAGGRDGAERGWFGAEERGALPLSSLVGKVLRLAEGDRGEVSPARPARRRGRPR
jgi:A/G-specific adenine glycosylase